MSTPLSLLLSLLLSRPRRAVASPSESPPAVVHAGPACATGATVSYAAPLLSDSSESLAPSTRSVMARLLADIGSGEAAEGRF